MAESLGVVAAGFQVLRLVEKQRAWIASLAEHMDNHTGLNELSVQIKDMLIALTDISEHVSNGTKPAITCKQSDVLSGIMKRLSVIHRNAKNARVRAIFFSRKR